MIFSIDFDGTLCENNYPDIGKPKYDIIDKCKKLKADGHKLILNTCRTDSDLDNALRWCGEQGLVFDAINENLSERIDEYGSNCRKIGADFYVDDKNLSLQEFVSYRSKSICPVCGNEMDETYMGTHYCKNCADYLIEDTYF